MVSQYLVVHSTVVTDRYLRTEFSGFGVIFCFFAGWPLPMRLLHHGEEPDVWLSLPVVGGLLALLLFGVILWQLYRHPR